MDIENYGTESVLVDKPNDEKVAYVSPELAELIPWFLDNRRKDIESVNQMLDVKDFKSLERLGHTLKGTCAGYGFDHLGHVGAQIEKAAKVEDTEEIRKLNEEMKSYLQEVKVVYK